MSSLFSFFLCFPPCGFFPPFFALVGSQEVLSERGSHLNPLPSPPSRFSRVHRRKDLVEQSRELATAFAATLAATMDRAGLTLAALFRLSDA